MMRPVGKQYRWSVFSADRQGVTSIEFAIGALVIATMFLGIVEWGRLFWTRQIMMHASDMAARCYSISSPQCSGTSSPARYAVSVAAADGLTISTSDVTAGSPPTCTSQTGGNLQVLFGLHHLQPCVARGVSALAPVRFHSKFPIRLLSDRHPRNFRASGNAPPAAVSDSSTNEPPLDFADRQRNALIHVIYVGQRETHGQSSAGGPAEAGR